MKQFNTLTSTALSIRTENIDTDQIIPAQFLKTTKKEGLGKYLFYNWRKSNKGQKKKNSIFNDFQQTRAQILIVGNNFGCGSSREHAVWALQDFGFKVIISSSFGDIFYTNSFKNGLLLIEIKKDKLKKLIEKVINPKIKVLIDLKKQIISTHSKNILLHFKIDAFKKNCLLYSVDELGFILSQEKRIVEFEKKHKVYLNIEN